MKVHKITTGFVVQEFDTQTGKCLSQEFVGDQVEWETKSGEPLDDLDFEYPLEMKGP